MFRDKAAILANLDPYDPATIQELINFHRATFGGFSMNATPPEVPAAGEASKPAEGEAGAVKPTDESGEPKPTDDPLGPGGLKALQAEREARQKIEKELREFKDGQVEQAKKLAEALGIKTEGAKPEDAVTELQKQIQQMQRDNLVYRIATDPAHVITDKDDLELIKLATDEEQMRKLATRLAKKAEAETEQKPGRRFPKQDTSQGRGSGSEGRATSVEQVRREREAARAAKQQKRNTQ